jgi:ABC-type branched-subunit amino acid transport system substrate-binding protein
MSRQHLRRAAILSGTVSLCLAGTVTGLTAATAGASGTPGVTANSITIGATVPLTGIASVGYSEVAKAANAVFKYVDSKGGVNGRRIRFVIKDDCYDACGGNPNTVSQTQALIALPVFATVGSLGTPTQDSVRNLLKRNGVPQLFVNSGSGDWNSPHTYPSLFGWQPSYQVESKILGDYIKAHFHGQKVCFIGQNDDFGRNGLAGLEDVGVIPAIQQMYSVVALVSSSGASFAPYMAAEKAASCKVVYLDTIPGATGAALGNAEAIGFSPHWIISGVGADPVTVKKEMGAIPDSEPGALTFSYLPASVQASSWHGWMYKVLEADHVDFPGFKASTPLDGNMEYGIGWGASFAEALKAAGRTFTRASFLRTLTTTAFQSPAVVPLQYSSSNHQGLHGGFVAKIKSVTQTEVVAPGTVYSTDSTKTGRVVVTHLLSSGIPTWLR